MRWWQRLLPGRRVQVDIEQVDPNYLLALDDLSQSYPDSAGALVRAGAIHEDLTGAREIIVKARAEQRRQKAAEERHWETDPWEPDTNWLGDYATQSHPGTIGLDYNTLRSMSRLPVINAIIETRINQIAELACRQPSPYSLGFRVVHKDPDRKPTKADQKEARRIEDWIETCGDPRVGGTATFEQFVRAVLRDSLIFDQANFECVFTRGGDLAGIVPVDAATVRKAKPTRDEQQSGKLGKARDHSVQIIGQRTVAEFDPKEMAFGVRRPRTWIKANGYGYPELEVLMRTITNLLNAEEYNANNFTHGIHAKGILAVKSKMGPQLWRSFKREFYAMLAGVSNAHRMPIVRLDPDNKEDISNVALSQTNREMEYKEWVNWLLKIACAVYQIDPSELGYVFGAEGQTSTLNEQGPAARIERSREQGLRPLARAVETWMNRWVIPHLNDDFRFEMRGLNDVSESERLKLDTDAVTHIETLNEVRARRGLPKLDNPMADVGPLDPQFVMYATQYMEQPEGDGGEEMGPGGPEGPGEGQEQPEGAEGAEGEDEGADVFDLSSLFGPQADEEEGGEEVARKSVGDGERPGMIKAITVEVST